MPTKKVDVELKLRVGKAGRIVIPKPIRDAYNIKEDDYVKIKIIEIEQESKKSKK